MHPAALTLNYLYLGLLFLALILIEFLAGGASLLFSLPSCAILSLAAVLTLASFRHKDLPANLFCLLGSAVFFGYVLLRIRTSPVEYLTRHDLFSVLGALIVYGLVAFYLTTPKLRMWLVLGLLVLSLINVALGAVQYFRHDPSGFLSFVPTNDYGARASGLYGCPDHLAGFFEVVGLMGLSAACWGRWKPWLRVSIGYVSSMCLVGIVLTGSRGGLLSAVGGCLVFIGLSLLVLRRGVLVHKWLVITCAVIVTALLAGGVAYFMSNQAALRLRWVNFLEKGGNRPEMWASAVKQFRLSPVLGTGSGTYLYYERRFRYPSDYADAIYAHNDYLHLLAEFGIIGLAGFLLFFGTHVGHGLRSFHWLTTERLNALGRVRSDTLALNIGVLSALSTYVIHSMFDFNLHIPANALLLAIVFGILANPGVETPFKSDHHVRDNLYWRLALPALGIWLALASLPTWGAEQLAKEARSAVSEERFQRGVRKALNGIAIDKGNPYLYLYLGESLFGIAESAPDPAAAETPLQNALQAYTKGLALFPQDRYLLLGMGWSFDALKQFDEAEPYFKKVLAWEPNSPQVHNYYAFHLHAAGRLDEAEAEYKKSTSIWATEAANLGLERLAKERAAAAAKPGQETK